MGRCNVLLDWVGGPFAIITENMPRAVLGRGANNLSSPKESIERPAKTPKISNSAVSESIWPAKRPDIFPIPAHAAILSSHVPSCSVRLEIHYMGQKSDGCIDM